MTRALESRLSFSAPSLSLLQIMALLVIGVMAFTFCSAPVTEAGLLRDAAMAVGGAALLVGSAAVALKAAPVIVTVSAVVAIGAGAVVLGDIVVDAVTSDNTSS